MDDHTLDEDGFHDEEQCYQCLLGKEVKCACRCGECCRSLLIEATVEDAEREPRIAQLGSPIYADARLTTSQERELEGFLLNDRKELGCVFLDPQTNLCTIYPTRPLACRLFDCDKASREQLIELGIIAKKGETG